MRTWVVAMSHELMSIAPLSLYLAWPTRVQRGGRAVDTC